VSALKMPVWGSVIPQSAPRLRISPVDGVSCCCHCQSCKSGEWEGNNAPLILGPVTLPPRIGMAVRMPRGPSGLVYSLFWHSTRLVYRKVRPGATGSGYSGREVFWELPSAARDARDSRREKCIARSGGQWSTIGSVDRWKWCRRYRKGSVTARWGSFVVVIRSSSPQVRYIIPGYILLWSTENSRM
jgi:hypothetical protein